MKKIEQILDELGKYIIHTAFQIKGRITVTGPLNFTEEIIYKINELKEEQKQVGDEQSS